MSRAMYSLARRGTGVAPKRMIQLDPDTNIPVNSMILAVGIGFLWLFVIFANEFWFGDFRFSLPDFYNFNFFAQLIVIFILFAVREKSLGFAKRFLFPAIATAGAGFMFTSYWLGSVRHALVYLGLFIVLAVIGFIFYKNAPQEVESNES